jgi:hypothetical protein
MRDEVKKKLLLKTFLFIIITVSFILLIIVTLVPKLYVDGPPAKDMVCLNNLKQLGLAFQMYAQDNSNTYPTPDKWCDLIKPYLHRGADEKIFRCPAAERARCHYAMNPYCEPNSPPGTVLLFETKGGWNLFGGPELLTTENHSNNKTHIYFKDSSYKRIRKEEIPNLKWNAEEKK